MTEREQILEAILRNTFWMARRYANGRKTYTPSVINNALSQLFFIGIKIEDDNTLIADGNSSSKFLD